MTADELMALDDETFCYVWTSLTDDVRQAMEGRSRCFARYNKLSPLPRRGNGADSGAIYLDQAEERTGADAPIDSRIMDLGELAKSAPPPREWIIPNWLSWAPTLVTGRGGVGKSLLSLQLAYSLAAATECLGKGNAYHRPLRVLYWACEDEYDEVWRRLDSISVSLEVPLAQMSGNLIIDSRHGLENELYGLQYGTPAWTSNRKLLREQVNDYQADVLILDNVAHIYSAGENNRPAVTSFINGIIGLCMDRPFCPMILAHPAKAEGSEFSGSTAWENAVRMRWFMSDKLPDQRTDSEEDSPSDSIRYLSKRKTNYTVLDCLQLVIENGAFSTVCSDSTDSGTMAALRNMRCRTIVLSSIQKINADGFTSSESYGPNYLPKQIIARGWSEGYTKVELHRAMMELIGEGRVKKDQIGVDKAWRTRFGLVVAL